MKTHGIDIVKPAPSAEMIAEGNFNAGEHLRVEIEAGKNQTISCKLPNGKFVTFAFVPGRGEEIECVDLHTNVGTPFSRGSEFNDALAYPQHLIGFRTGGHETFDTRSGGHSTSLATLLLASRHYAGKTKLG